MLKLFIEISLIQFSLAVRRLSELVQDQPELLKYHDGPLLTGRIKINLIWYGNFKPSERAIIADFVTSLSSKSLSSQKSQPTVAQWWSSAEKYYHLDSRKPSLSLSLGKQILDEHCSLGKSLKDKQIIELVSKGDQKDTINVVLTASDVTVEGSTQCPGQCAWPFYRPIYGPQSPPLIAPNDNVGLDGMVINLASLFAGTVTNPFGNGYFQGQAKAPLEASSACPGIYGKGAYPGYAGKLLVDSSTGASYNAHGDHGSKYLLPALYDPATLSCKTLV
ncbi:Protein EXORDIUM-like 1 [Hibiscus syriacus]|uniref:Protein EXORDIUM-like 1 n=1 Tax=Hibiscus syriacus TaxID=106335 RepID=A0A6A3CCY9_HIBSY|nr:Protein EXORDIUM-like 1 [Hibiscus syriacus]